MEYKNYNKRPNKKNYMGYVTRWNKRGYGFVRCYDDGETYYCSKKVINDEPYLVPGSIVNFQIGHGVDRDGEPMSYAYNLLMVEEWEPTEKKQRKKGKKRNK